jgi:hypothetical protein
MSPILKGVVASSKPSAFTTGTYDAIATQILAGGETSIAFTSIPQDYTHLQIRGMVRSNTGDADLYMQLGNGSIDTGANYSWHLMYGEGAASLNSAYASSTSSIFAAQLPYSGTTASTFGSFIINLLDYKNANKNKTALINEGKSMYSASYTPTYAQITGNWYSGSAITNIKFFNNNSTALAAYSEISLYGIKGA